MGKLWPYSPCHDCFCGYILPSSPSTDKLHHAEQQSNACYSTTTCSLPCPGPLTLLLKYLLGASGFSPIGPWPIVIQNQHRSLNIATENITPQCYGLLPSQRVSIGPALCFHGPGLTASACMIINYLFSHSAQWPQPRPGPAVLRDGYTIRASPCTKSL